MLCAQLLLFVLFCLLPSYREIFRYLPFPLLAALMYVVAGCLFLFLLRSSRAVACLLEQRSLLWLLPLIWIVAAWLVYRSAGPGGRQFPMSVYVVHLILNALWSWLFFAWHLGGLAFAEIVLLLTVIAMMMALFWRINRLAGMLLIPYAGWVAFATALNFALWRMNPGLL